MVVTLIGKEFIYKVKLPQRVIGTYWIKDNNNKKLIKIEGNGKDWQIVSNSYFKIIDPECMSSINALKLAESEENLLNKAILKQYSINYVYLSKLSDNVCILYCSPTYENNFQCLNFKNFSQILIGKDRENDIIYDNPLIEGKQARIFLSNGQLMLENYDKIFGTFVNNLPTTKRLKLLFNGDTIFIMGLKIIIMGKSIYINNPFNRVTYNKEIFEIAPKKGKLPDLELEETEEELELYTDKDYFARAPRITNVIEHETIKIEPPPENQNKDGMPFMFVLGSSMLMGLISLISMISIIDGIASGKSELRDSIFSLLMTFVMLLSMVLLPILNAKYEKKQKKKREKTRQIRYKKYINSKIKQIDEVMNKQKQILYDNYISAQECADIIINKSPRLWERKIEKSDFLTVRIGIGNLPLVADIEYPAQEFTMEDDNLVEILSKIANKSKIIKEVPITYSLAEKNISAVIVENDERIQEKFVQNIIMQLIALHNYNELKLVFFLKDDKNKKWQHFKTLPHIWNNTKQIRFWAENHNDMKDISRFLEQEMEARLNIRDANYTMFESYYLIITDNYKEIENLKIITDILKQQVNVGFSIFCVTDNILQLPNECKVFVKIKGNDGVLLENEIISNNQKEFTFDSSYTFFFEEMGKRLSNIPIKITSESTLALPNNYSFLEMYDVGRIEQLNILKRWLSNDSTVSLEAPIGIDTAGMPIVLDIHEKFHGPHGLIAGSTGSGKSEFIITYILSLAINYHPDDVTMIFIDYKGGGLAGAFKKKKVKLPHLVGTITNIDTVGLQRSLASIQSELRRRQILFNEARNKTEEGTIDIYKYQKLYHEGIVKEAIPHLLIVCDEFAELKQQQADFMDELISVARIGRSLGVHLILATQKPAGVVNDQIRSNSKFAICLKVQDTSDSVDVIKSPEAAMLKRAGQFYMQVGNNEYFILGQSAYSGAPYIPADVITKTADNSIEFVSNTGDVIKKINNIKKTENNHQGEQLTNIVKYMYELAEKENIKTKALWMENIPENIFIDEIRKKYQIKEIPHEIAPVIGEYDDPFNQRQGPVKIDFQKGNVLVYGNAESGKETLLSTMVYDIMTQYKATEVQLYLIDFGSESLKIFKESPLVGDVVLANDTEKIGRLFNMLQKEMKSRVSILSNYGGDYKLYVNTDGNIMPMYIIAINNYQSFQEIYEDEYDEILLTLTREGLKCGINFMFTISNHNDVKYRMSQNFSQRIALQLNNEDDYMSIFDSVGKKRPSHIFGRGLVKIEDIYEFQTAKICETIKWNKFISETIENLKKTNKVIANPIPVLPDTVLLKDMKQNVKNLKELPIGLGKEDLNIVTYDFKKKLVNIMVAKNIDIVARFTASIIEEMQQLDNVNVVLFDVERILKTGKENLKLNYKNFTLEVKNNLKKNKEIVCIIIGVDKFMNSLEEEGIEFLETLREAEKLKNYTFIMVENLTKLKNREYDDWYKEYITRDNGIWVGNGLADQYLINVDTTSKQIINRCGNDFGYTIKNEIATLVKLVGMKEQED